MDRAPPAKRIKLVGEAAKSNIIRAQRAAFLSSLSRAVSPPLGSTSKAISSARQSGLPDDDGRKSVPPSSQLRDGIKPVKTRSQSGTSPRSEKHNNEQAVPAKPTIVPSPFQLTKIRDLEASENKDTISLHDILGDPLIKEAWVFNFCFDVDWLMQHFDPDVRDLVQVKIVHGSWRNEDVNKIGIDHACSQRSNVKAIQAYMPDAFGTHHSKMFVLFRHDDSAQVVIHTANMLAKDWTNMTQAVWRSPLLPLRKKKMAQNEESSVGNQFQQDLLRYVKAYGSKLKSLAAHIPLYDFSDVKAVLVASVPSKFKRSAGDKEVWGHEILRRKLEAVKTPPANGSSTSCFVFQISSIASLAANWLEDTLYVACGATKATTSIIFPTAPDVAISLDGYASGGSIHTKAQKPVHLKQISLLRPQLCRWTEGRSTIARAGRNFAAPHIKTYVRFSSQPSQDQPTPDVEWALVTSANLSTQAWGTAPKLAKGEKNAKDAVIHIQSFEIGVLVYPELYASNRSDSTAEEESVVKMVPSFKTDDPMTVDRGFDTVVGFRMPYDLPLTPYGPEELPWSPQSNYSVPDRHGHLWV